MKKPIKLCTNFEFLSATLILLNGKEFTIADGFHLEVLAENERGTALCEIQDITHPEFLKFNGLQISLRKNRLKLVNLPKRNRVKISDRMKERLKNTQNKKVLG